ncbi:MAG TPA: type II toxin-antitoxin system prevent-host-death family antitoxin [Actinocrinis sp.]|nr:type II toxin-antitoxin system prevent-host-death family antitoxin [Actinocrinis sp.]
MSVFESNDPIEYNVHEAKNQSSRILARVERGEEITINRAGEPIAKIIPFRRPRPDRKPGAWRNKVVVHEGFDELPEDVVSAFAGDGAFSPGTGS